MISKSRLMMASENPEMQYMWVVNENFQALADSLKQRKNRDTKTEVQSVLSQAVGYQTGSDENSQCPSSFFSDHKSSKKTDFELEFSKKSKAISKNLFADPPRV